MYKRTFQHVKYDKMVTVFCRYFLAHEQNLEFAHRNFEQPEWKTNYKSSPLNNLLQNSESGSATFLRPPPSSNLSFFLLVLISFCQNFINLIKNPSTCTNIKFWKTLQEKFQDEKKQKQNKANGVFISKKTKWHQRYSPVIFG